MTRSKKPRTFYVAADVVGEVEAYMDSSRAWAVGRAQKKGQCERLPEMRLVTEVTRRVNPVVRWHDRHGVAGARELNELTVAERMLLFTEAVRAAH